MYKLMALLHSLKPCNSHLPHPQGPLSAAIPPTVINLVNKELASKLKRKQQNVLAFSDSLSFQAKIF